MGEQQTGADIQEVLMHTEPLGPLPRQEGDTESLDQSKGEEIGVSISYFQRETGKSVWETLKDEKSPMDQSLHLLLGVDAVEIPETGSLKRDMIGNVRAIHVSKKGELHVSNKIFRVAAIDIDEGAQARLNIVDSCNITGKMGGVVVGALIQDSSIRIDSSFLHVSSARKVHMAVSKGKARIENMSDFSKLNVDQGDAFVTVCHGSQILVGAGATVRVRTAEGSTFTVEKGGVLQIDDWRNCVFQSQEGGTIQSMFHDGESPREQSQKGKSPQSGIELKGRDIKERMGYVFQTRDE